MKGNTFALFVGVIATIGFGFARTAHAQNDPVKSCIATWTAACSADCATARCVSNCAAQAHDVCTKDITTPQHVFNGPVSATPTDACEVGAPPVCSSPNITPDAPCSVVRGTVADRALCGGNVTISVICPQGSPVGTESQGTTLSVIAQTASDATTCGFTVTTTNQCTGVTGCYAVIAVTPPTATGDPGWSTCTAGPCPSPKQ